MFKLNQTEKTMKKTSLFALALMPAFLIPAFQQIHAAAQTIDGVVTDSMCGKKHMMPGKSDAECTKECAKSGSSYSLVVGAKVYMLAAKPQTIAPFAGKHVHVAGSVKDNTITVTAISEAMQGMKM
jgi:hypothetical protein